MSSFGSPSREAKKDSRGSFLRKAVFRALLATAVALVAGFVSWFFLLRPAPSETGPTEAAPIVIKTETKEELPTGFDAPAPEGAAAPKPSTAPYQSERFRAGEIAVGGEMSLIVPDSDTAPLAIESVRGEAFSSKTESKLVITWETNKPARSELAYGKGIGQAEAVIKETEFGTSHSVIIPDVTPASTYVYIISARDKWGGEAVSDPYAVYTGAKEVSLFELMAGAVGDVFGWAVSE